MKPRVCHDCLRRIQRGFLSASIKSVDDLFDKDRRRAKPRFSAENIEKNNKKIVVLEEVARESGYKPAQIALAWILSQDQLIAPIPGTKHRNFVDENVQAIKIELKNDQIRQLSSAFPIGKTAGARYSADQMKMLNL
jgi:aryl-alcohol dehydrogenase-like predicted oxidoreductase